ncbi:tail fiber assembly protein [Gluconacetobacter sp.]|uniref:tail fiber assembly protein n=1 Tax=Gluconacetobacter sp. TaxID=1935994 RepID=UPI0039E891FB
MTDSANYYFSPGKNAFYPSALQPRYEAAGTWPADLVAVTDDAFAEFGLATPPAGQIRGVTAAGAPCWVAAPVVAIPLVRLAQQALASARATLWADYGSLGAAVPAEWVTYQRALLAIVSGTDTTSTALPSAPGS